MLPQPSVQDTTVNQESSKSIHRGGAITDLNKGAHLALVLIVLDLCCAVLLLKLQVEAESDRIA